jgi:F-type H+-transporting ATPase subunit delta
MFHPDRWAQAFTAACGEDAESGLSALKALLACLRCLPAPVTGDYTARQLEGMMRRAAGAAGVSQTSRGFETAVRFILLLVKKGCFRQGGRAVEEIEDLLDRKKGILKVAVEAAVPPDPAFEAGLKTALRAKTAALQVEAEIRIRPELLGGYRLIIGSDVWDASLRGEIQNMARTLEAAPGAGASDGGFA